MKRVARRSEPAEKGRSMLLRFRARNTPYGVTKDTAQKLAEHLGLSETDLMHRLLAQAAARELPQYEQDDGPLSDEAARAIARHQPREIGALRASLLD